MSQYEVDREQAAVEPQGVCPKCLEAIFLGECECTADALEAEFMQEHECTSDCRRVGCETVGRNKR
jgi:hypothetical protein